MLNNNINKELEKAVYKRNLEKVKALLSAGANANLRVERNRDTLLHTTSSIEITKELLLGGAEVNSRNMYSETPLHSAITLGKELELVRELLKHGADVN
ncbi:ankyrin repeat domain-containing protein, partial [Wolbachia endosymbiont of Nasonia vitripennis]|uniref:ankyrin repeat domain-containing protein n=1 Tax=Wolbachia endosymbiont of Nasonia vitripennis TaxID=180837 RepID=UPI0002374B3C